jgi:hypothetical protein
MRLVGRPEGKRMTFEIALLIASGVLVSALIWQLHWVRRRQLSEIQRQVNALRDQVSRAFMMQLNRKIGDTLSSGAEPPPRPSEATVKSEVRDHDVPQLELELETPQIGELCAKLITLVPPEEAASLLSQEREPLEARERRLVPRYQTSKIGRILHYGRPDDVCTVSNTSHGGALLLVANAYGLPEQFDLHLDGYSRRCTARWRRLDRIGVKFKSIAAA